MTLVQDIALFVAGVIAVRLGVNAVEIMDRRLFIRTHDLIVPTILLLGGTAAVILSVGFALLGVAR